MHLFSDIGKSTFSEKNVRVHSLNSSLVHLTEGSNEVTGQASLVGRRCRPLPVNIFNDFVSLVHLTEGSNEVTGQASLVGRRCRPLPVNIFNDFVSATGEPIKT